MVNEEILTGEGKEIDAAFSKFFYVPRNSSVLPLLLGSFVLISSIALKNYSVTHQWLLPFMYVNAVFPILISVYIILRPTQFPTPRRQTVPTKAD